MYHSAQSFVRSLFVLALVLALIGIATPPVPAYAQAVTVSGTIDATSGCMIDGSPFSVPYDSFSFTVPTTASYTISFVSKTIANDFPIILYAGYNPSLDWVQPALIGITFSNSTPLTATLTAGTTYEVVVNNWQYFANMLACEGRATTVSGNYVLEFSGPIILPNSTTAQPAPQAGMISISTAQAQPVYESAGGDVVRDGGKELRLPQDFDGNGFDTHLVMSSTEVDGQLWYEIWIGGQGTTVWLPADNVTVVE